MSYYELFKQGPEVYIPVLLASLVITVLAYGAFPFIFAKIRKSPITKKKYRWLCFGINAALMLLFGIINGNFSGAYFLWTFVFYKYGIKILDLRGLMTDSDYLPNDPNRVTECKSCGYRDKNFFNACPKCGKYAKQYVYLNNEPKQQVTECKTCGYKGTVPFSTCPQCGEYMHKPNKSSATLQKPVQVVKINNSAPPIQNDKICFCRKCGTKLFEDSQFCHKCGTEVRS